ncbi:PAS domain-containing protein [Rhodobacterales bacterium HKCCE2091]|nr:PAS domain-containing protein [Rhodobacterales bacterium HKCCE2091]
MFKFNRPSGATPGAATEAERAIVQLVENTQATIHFKPDGTILHANKNFLDTMGYSLEEVVGKHHSMFVYPTFVNKPDYAEFWRRLQSGESFSDRFPRVAKSGEVVWIQATYAPIRDDAGQVNRVVKIATVVSNSQKAIRDIRAALVELKAGNLTHRIEVSPEPGMAEIGEGFNEAVSQLEALVARITDAAGQVHGASRSTISASEELSLRTENQAATLEETAAAVDNLTENAREAADRADAVNNTAEATRRTAESSGTVVREAIEAMDKIEASSGRISKIISVIEDLAFQTNLLALNAAVEAARAGESGRGFAVVANEVRNLAQRSAESAQEIKQLIAESSNQVGDGVGLVRRAGTELSDIFAGVGEISENIREVAMGLAEQSSTLAEINTALSQLDRVTQDNAAMVQETAEAANSLAQVADAVAEDIAVFTISAQIVPHRTGLASAA